MSEEIPADQVRSITVERAEKIASGEEEFPSTQAAVPLTGISDTLRLLRISVIVLGASTVAAIISLVAFTIYRGWERSTFDRTVNELTTARAADRETMRVLRNTVDDLRLEISDLTIDLGMANETLGCRAASNLESDVAQAELLRIMGTQFATALDQGSRSADAAAILEAANKLDAALNQRAETISGC